MSTIPATPWTKNPAPRPPTYPVPVETNEEDAQLGQIQIHNSVMAIIARMAALRVPGVADVVGSLVGDMAGRIGIKAQDRGVHVDLADDQISLNISLSVDYGVFIPKVAWQVQTEVRRSVEEMTGKTVKAVNITVRGLRTPPGETALAEAMDEEIS